MLFTTEKISENIYEFTESQDYGDGVSRPYVDAYLYIGKHRAVLVDTLMKATGIYDEVRKITDLPFDVLITHGHGDHVGAAAKEFAAAGVPIYMDMADFGLLSSRNPEVRAEWFTPLKDGDHFCLGDRELITIACPGHSAGSVAFLDKENKLLFSGDTVGSGTIWMQIPGALPLATFEPGVKKLMEILIPLGLDDILVYPGHRNQSQVQLTGQYVKDCWYITQGILRGTIKGTEKVLDLPGRHMEFLEVKHGMMNSYCYDPEKLRFPKREAAEKARIEALKDLYTAETYRSGSNAMDYMLFTPELKDGERYPLVVYLHGGGERGSQPRVALGNNGGWVFVEPDWQAKHPCFVIAPQVAEDGAWVEERYTTMLRDLIMQLTFTLPIDNARVYITGLSLGGAGTWQMISLYPDLFAGAVPICGAGDPFAVRNAKWVPVWAAHAADDPVVNCVGKIEGLHADKVGAYGSRIMVNSLRGAGNHRVRYTEFPEGYMAAKGLHPHLSWIEIYESEEVKEWLFAQNRMDVYQIDMVSPGFYHISDFGDDSIYILEGTERALVVDTGLADNDFMAMVKEVTKLPADLAITHCHPDHAYHIDKFERFYMSPKDQPLFKNMYSENPNLPQEKREAYQKAQLIPVADGDIIDLGGGYEVEVFDLGGHTPGSVVFLDKKRGYAMIGDATGVWMQVPGAMGIAHYKKELEHFVERMSAPEYKDVVMMNGHRKQEDASFKYGMDYTPNNLQKSKDMIVLCDKLLKEQVEFTESPFSFGEQAYQAEYKQARMVFDMTHLHMK